MFDTAAEKMGMQAHTAETNCGVGCHCVWGMLRRVWDWLRVPLLAAL